MKITDEATAREIAEKAFGPHHPISCEWSACVNAITDALAAARRDERNKTVEKCIRTVHDMPVVDLKIWWRNQVDCAIRAAFPPDAKPEDKGESSPAMRECNVCEKLSSYEAWGGANQCPMCGRVNGTATQPPDARQRFDAAAVELANEFFEGIETMDEEGEDIGPDGLRVQSIAANVLNAARELGILTEEKP